jgi:hypothetical protein
MTPTYVSGTLNDMRTIAEELFVMMEYDGHENWVYPYGVGSIEAS